MLTISSTSLTLSLAALLAACSADHTARRSANLEDPGHGIVPDSDGDGWADDGYQAGCSGVLFRTADQCWAEDGLDPEDDSSLEVTEQIGACWDAANVASDACCRDYPDDDGCSEGDDEDRCDGYDPEAHVACVEANGAAYDRCIAEAGLTVEDLEELSDAEAEVSSDCAAEASARFDDCDGCP